MAGSSYQGARQVKGKPKKEDYEVNEPQYQSHPFINSEASLISISMFSPSIQAKIVQSESKMFVCGVH